MDNKQKKMAFLGVLLLGCVATSWLQQGKEAKQAVPAPILNKQLASSTAKEKKEKTIQVYVSGAVREPGIYTLPAGSRTMTALEAAGGMRPDARAERVNLAKKLRDGSHVYVPAVKNTSATTNMTSKASKNQHKMRKQRALRARRAAGAILVMLTVRLISIPLRKQSSSLYRE